MAQTADTSHRPLMPSPKELQKALKRSADQAQRLADAYGRKLPVTTPRVADKTTLAHHA